MAHPEAEKQPLELADKRKKVAQENSDSEEDDDVGTPELSVDSLSAFTLAALQAHLAEAEAQQQEWRIGDVSENFAMSQFWYTPETSTALVNEVLHQCGQEGRGVVMSAPSLFNVIKGDAAAMGRVSLLEFDDRFGVMYPDAFHKYDFNEPEVLPPSLTGQCDVILLDPPYLNMETLRAFMQSAKLLARNELSRASEQEQEQEGKFTRCMVVTASILEPSVREEFGLVPTTFAIEHTSKLSNPLCCYVNFKPTHAKVALSSLQQDDGPV